MKLYKAAVSVFVSSVLALTQEEIKNEVGEGCPNKFSFTSSFLFDGGDVCTSCSYCPGSLSGHLFDPKLSSTCVECGDSNSCNTLQLIMSFDVAWKMSFFPLFSSNTSPSNDPRRIVVKGSNSYDGDVGSNVNSWITLYDSDEKEDLDFSSGSEEHLLMLNTSEEYKFYSVSFHRNPNKGSKLQVGHIGIVQSYLRECSSNIFKKLTGEVVPAYIYEFSTKKELENARDEWMKDETKATMKYGHISQWKVGKITDMSMLFYRTSFNEDVSLWDTSKVTSMDYMFEESAFNQDLSAWNTSKVSTMIGMFGHAKAFNKVLCWDISKVIYADEMFEGTKGGQLKSKAGTNPDFETDDMWIPGC